MSECRPTPTVTAPPRRTFHVIQYLRAAAAALVVFYHASHEVISNAGGPSLLRAWPEVPAVGASGVDMFFVISGFIIFTTMPAARGRGAALAFMHQRTLRVMPLYWFWTSALVILMLAGVALTATPLSPMIVATSYALIPYELRPDYYHPLLDPGWTLSFEMLFYLAAAVAIAWLPPRLRLPGLAAMLLTLQAATWAAALTVPISPGFTRWLGSPLFYEFLAGAGLAVLFDAPRHAARVGAHPRLGWALVGAGAACLAASTALPDPIAWRVVVWGAPSAAIVAGAVLAERPPGGPATRLLLWLGAASYSLYASHYLATAALGGVVRRGYLGGLDPDALAVGASLAIIALGSLSYVAVERPLRALSRRALPRPGASGHPGLGAARSRSI